MSDDRAGIRELPLFFPYILSYNIFIYAPRPRINAQVTSGRATFALFDHSSRNTKTSHEVILFDKFR